jgi:FdhE protein
MPRILEPGQIEAFAQRDEPRIRLPRAEGPFPSRARRLRQLAQPGASGHAIAEYLELAAVIAESQARALPDFPAVPPTADEIERARTHRMPVIHATGRPRPPAWRDLAITLLSSAAASSGTPARVREIEQRVRALSVAELEAQADALLAARLGEIDMAAAPFLMAALQVQWVALASRLEAADVAALEVPGVCPACGTLPVASVVHADQDSQGYRYLHCALCATEWHLVRVTCSQCQNTENMGYHSIEGARQQSAPRVAIGAAPTARSSTRRKTRAWSRWPTIWRASRSTC